MKVIINYFLYLLLIFAGNYSSMVDDSNISLNTKDSYYFILSIPSINLEEKVYEYNSNNNDVNKGIYLAKDYNFSNMKGSLILASHSGNSKISYFKNLNYLSNNDIVIIKKNDTTYYYKIIDNYKIEKNGSFKYKNLDNHIYLITCDKKNKKKQLVYTGKLIKTTKKSSFF